MDERKEEKFYMWEICFIKINVIVCVCVCVGGGIVYNYSHDGCGENGLISDSIIMINLDCTI